MKKYFPVTRCDNFWKTISLLLVLPLCALAVENAADLSKIKPVGDKAWDEKKILETAEARIQEYRTGQAELRVLDQDGQPLRNTEVRVRLVTHEFKLGCNGFLLETLNDAALQQAYEDRFAALLNYATLPLYWETYEPVPGKTKELEVKKMAAWCRAHGITAKGHPLAWHHVYPPWANALPDAEALKLQRARITDLVGTFKDSIDIFDVINETTVSAEFGNAVGRWVKSSGAAPVVAEVLTLAHQANPQAKLLYNDFNISAGFEQLVADVQKMKAPLDAVGIQTHMHKELWPMDKLWTVCETYARFGLPLDFTELTILSGKFKDKDDNDWSTERKDWNTTPEGEQRQLEYGQKLYTVLFSHPAVEAITWWDFSDLQSWTAAPSGLLRKDMSPKPLYVWLQDSFHRKWSTDVVVKSDESGLVKVQAFYGEYEVTAKNSAGTELKTRLSFPKNGPKKLQASLK